MKKSNLPLKLGLAALPAVAALMRATSARAWESWFDREEP